ncbi:MAG: hypothetical protein J6K96_05900 [Treponema sp.]|nr:hypothetical protein [Treponema sp.]
MSYIFRTACRTGFCAGTAAAGAVAQEHKFQQKKNTAADRKKAPRLFPFCVHSLSENNFIRQNLFALYHIQEKKKREAFFEKKSTLILTYTPCVYIL